MISKQLRFSGAFFSLSRFAFAAFIFLGMTRLAMGASYVSITHPAHNAHICGTSVDVTATDDNPHGVSEVDCGVNGGATSPMNYDDYDNYWYTTVGLSTGNNTILCVDGDGYSDSVTVTSVSSITKSASSPMMDPQIHSLCYNSAPPCLLCSWESVKKDLDMTATITYNLGDSTANITFTSSGTCAASGLQALNNVALSGSADWPPDFVGNPSSSEAVITADAVDGGCWKYTGNGRWFHLTWNVDTSGCAATISISQATVTFH
jgi:hypothetical protein